jgi:YjgF/chorismate_mutase-like, putative endoribonuclease/SnoaL-like domain
MTQITTNNPDHAYVFEEWHRAASTRDQSALIALYADDAVLETPLAASILADKTDGVLRGKSEIQRFLDEGAKRRPNGLVRWQRDGRWFSSGNILIWEYPRETPEGDQIELIEVMEIVDKKIKRHRIYWGWFGMHHLIENTIAKRKESALTSNSARGVVESRLAEGSLILPKPWKLPAGIVTSASFTRQQGQRLIVSGHVPLDDEGLVCGPYGKVGAEVSLAEATTAAQRCTLAILSSVQAAIGSLDRIEAWTMIRGYVNCAPDFNEFPKVLNGCSDILRAAFGPDVGAHARVAVGIAGLPFNSPVEIEAELILKE